VAFEVIVSFVFAYILLGVYQLSQDIQADEMKKPMWTYRPTPIKIMLAIATWVLRPVMLSFKSNRHVAISIYNTMIDIIMFTVLFYTATRYGRTISETIIVKTMFGLIVGTILSPFYSVIYKIILLPVNCIFWLLISSMFSSKPFYETTD